MEGKNLGALCSNMDILKSGLDEQRCVCIKKLARHERQNYSAEITFDNAYKKLTILAKKRSPKNQERLQFFIGYVPHSIYIVQ